jgi:hypothetical protein
MYPDDPLWQRLYVFHPDKPGAVLPFSKRLAIENGWTRRFALRAIGEYKRFLYLACVAGHPVTPSEEIDQVWHLHLVYTRSYWDELCAAVLQRPMHHQPTEGGRGEDARYWEQYEQTLAAYRRVFGEPPPADVWPEAKKRFAGGLWRWVNRSKFWVVRKPW